MIFQDIIFQNDILEYDFQRLTARVEVAATWPCFRLINLHLFSTSAEKQTYPGLLQEDLIDVMPAVEEANSISEELDKRVKFEIILIRLVPGVPNFRRQI